MMCKELVQTIKARNWALATFNFFNNPCIHINVNGWSNDDIFILDEVPQRYHFVELPLWFSRVDTENDIKYVIYDKDLYDFDKDCELEPQNLYIHRFEDGEQIYYGVYYENGKRVSEQCLILFQRSEGENVGCAEGRCPETIEQIEV